MNLNYGYKDKGQYTLIPRKHVKIGLKKGFEGFTFFEILKKQLVNPLYPNTTKLAS